MAQGGITRRRFALGVAAAPVALAAGKPLLAQAAEQQGNAAVSKYDAPDPFAGPLDFHRRDAIPATSPFPLSQVHLAAGPLQQARDWNAGYMKRLSSDRLLHNFRVTAGLPSSATPLGGWEKPDCELRGHFVGHYMSACGQMAASGDSSDCKELKQRGDAIVAGIAECQAKLDDNGYVSAFPVEEFTRLGEGRKVWAPFYTLHKLMAGLLDMHTLGGSQQAGEVVVAMAGWVDAWTGQRSEEQMQRVLEVEFGGMNDLLYNLAVATNDDRWARVGDRFTKKRVFTPLGLQRDELRGLHANTHQPQMIGAARRYEISKDARFRSVAEFFFETISTSRTYAAGGSGVREHWEGQPNFLAAEWSRAASHQECCCAYNMMKLSRHLHAWTGGERFIDYYERNLYNHRLGTIQPKTGLTSYFLSMSPGAWKATATEDDSFWCCNGTALEEYSKLQDTIYWRDADGGLRVNLFVPSVVDWQERGIRVAQRTGFPREQSTELVIEQSPTEAWPLRIRVPRWVGKGSGVSINGKRLEATAVPGSYIEIARVWKKGDRVRIDLPMELRTEGFADDESLRAFVVGPIVLAGQFPRGDITPQLATHQQGPDIKALPMTVPTLRSTREDATHLAKPVPGEPLMHTLATSGQPVTLKPLNESWDRFVVYWKLA